MVSVLVGKYASLTYWHCFGMWHLKYLFKVGKNLVKNKQSDLVKWTKVTA